VSQDHTASNALEAYLLKNTIYCTGPKRSHRVLLRWSPAKVNLFCDWPAEEAKDGACMEMMIKLEIMIKLEAKWMGTMIYIFFVSIGIIVYVQLYVLLTDTSIVGFKKFFLSLES
jgi:hypothetical protein